jgi:hypothetical protein
MRELEPHRQSLVPLDGDQVPGSVPILMAMLDAGTDSDKRYDLYRHLIFECSLAGRTAAAVRFSAARYAEFGDVTALSDYAQRLVEHGDFAQGLARAKEAVALAIASRALINYAAGQYVRNAIKTGSVAWVNEALETFCISTRDPRDTDCALEADWADDAEALGADRELIDWVRWVAPPDPPRRRE